MTQIFTVAFLFSFCWFAINAHDCVKRSISTASGAKAPKGPLCSGQLIFEDNFDLLDPDVWHHEVQFSHVSKSLLTYFQRT